MTTPEQMKRLAEVVEPDREWGIMTNPFSDGEIVFSKHPEFGYDIFNPEIDNAQLMQVVFALWESLKDTLLYLVVYEGGGAFNKYAAELTDFETLRDEVKHLGKTREEAIVKLAVEVLCND